MTEGDSAFDVGPVLAETLELLTLRRKEFCILNRNCGGIGKGLYESGIAFCERINFMAVQVDKSHNLLLRYHGNAHPAADVT